MRFRVARMDSASCGAKCPRVVVAEGVIEEDTPLEFIDFMRTAVYSSGLRSVVFLNSPGGNVVASMELGMAFRQLHVAAVVAGFGNDGAESGPIAGECVSACVYAFMGAVRRVAPPVSKRRPASDVGDPVRRGRRHRRLSAFRRPADGCSALALRLAHGGQSRSRPHRRRASARSHSNTEFEGDCSLATCGASIVGAANPLGLRGALDLLASWPIRLAQRGSSSVG